MMHQHFKKFSYALCILSTTIDLNCFLTTRTNHVDQTQFQIMSDDGNEIRSKLIEALYHDDNNEELIRLLHNGADPSFPIMVSRTSANGKQILEKYEALGIKCSTEDLWLSTGETALHEACSLRRIAYPVIAALIQHGANWTQKTTLLGQTPEDLVLENMLKEPGVIEERLNSRKKTALLFKKLRIFQSPQAYHHIQQTDPGFIDDFWKHIEGNYRRFYIDRLTPPLFKLQYFLNPTAIAQWKKEFDDEDWKNMIRNEEGFYNKQ